MQIALYQPEIAANVGSVIRTCAGFGLDLIIIYPLGFVWNDQKLNRSKMDYNTNITHIHNIQHLSTQNLIAVSCSGRIPYYQYSPNTNDIFIFGKESTGLSTFTHTVKDSITIPILTRSLNLSVSVAIIASYMIRAIHSNSIISLNQNNTL